MGRMEKFRRELGRQGFASRWSSRRHLIVTLHGQTVAVFAGTPSDFRSHRNGLARLRRAGFVFDSSL